MREGRDMMTTATLKVPNELNAADVMLAIETCAPTPAEWPEGEKYLGAPQCEALAKVMIGGIHEHLKDARIAYVFREDIGNRGRVVLAKASKPGGALAWLTGVDFLISFNFTHWRDLDVAARCALVDHELAHFEHDLDTGKYFLVGHDLEEFHAIVRRWGFWRPDLVAFAEVVKVQLELFKVGP